MATAIVPPKPMCSVCIVRLNVCSSSRFMPNCTEVMGSIAPALTCRQAGSSASAHGSERVQRGVVSRCSAG